MATRLTMYAAAQYRVCVQGRLAERWLQWPGLDLTIEKDAADPDWGVTMLTAQLSDQAALLGLLTSLYETNLPILSVEHVEPSTQNEARIE